MSVSGLTPMSVLPDLLDKPFGFIDAFPLGNTTFNSHFVIAFRTGVWRVMILVFIP